jgi:menaquinone-dependent protoporphyrinogen oxidase
MDYLNLFFGFKSKKRSTGPEKFSTGTAIVFMSMHGTTYKVACLIKDLLNENSTILIDLEKEKTPDLSLCSRIIIGGSIHLGEIQKEIKLFCENNKAILLSKQYGLFLCCMYDGDKATEQFNNAYSEIFRTNAKSKALMGYELNFDRMTLAQRNITKNMTGFSGFMSKINFDELNRFVKEMKS